MRVEIRSPGGRRGEARLRLGGLATAIVALTASCMPMKPDLFALYGSRIKSERVPVIVVHGILGARLRDSRSERWPGSFWRLLFEDYSDLSLPIDAVTLEPQDDGLRATGFVDSAGGRDFYRELLRTLAGPGGYRISGARPTLYPFYYDWRRSNVENAARLDELIERIRREHGSPELRVDIVAHSMGGLLVRYYERFGGVDVIDDDPPQITGAGGHKLRRIVLVGTPNFGSITGLQRALMGERIGLGMIGPEVGATWPSMYELLPNPDRDWMIDIHGERIDRDLFDIGTWRFYGWSIFDPEIRARVRRRFRDDAAASSYLATIERYMEHQLARARRFHRAISMRQEECVPRYIVFGGACILTAARCLVEVIDGHTHIRLHPSLIARPIAGVDYARLMLEPGDGRVTKASALARASLDPTSNRPGTFPLAYSIFLCREHSDLPGDITFRDNLLNILVGQ